MSLTQNKIFSMFRIDSVAGNCILLEIGCSNFLKALTSPRTAPLVCIKLVKRGGQPCICVMARVSECSRRHGCAQSRPAGSELAKWFASKPLPRHILSDRLSTCLNTR